MTFNSFEFLLFYPLIAIAYFLLPRSCKMPLLLLGSYFFYGYYQPYLLILIVATTAVSYFASWIISVSKSPAIRKLALAVTLVITLGVLFFFKYFNFFMECIFGVINLFGADAGNLSLSIILPVGISFYTFQSLSYVIDVYRGDIEREKSFICYATFVSYFPQLVAGPIERPGNLIPQLKSEHRFNSADFKIGSRVMLLGFFKKICVADVFAQYVNKIFNDPQNATGLGVVIAVLMFSVQIYCDFSGYTDIATGCARIMGIKLCKNFDRPYSSSSIKEFWSRWHISLSSWLKDYLYIPLGGSRVRLPRYCLNLIIVFLASGLWHGANYTFVLWGLLHGVYQVVGVLTKDARARVIAKCNKSEDDAAVRAVRTVITFALVCFSWLVFRANSLSDIALLLTRPFTNGGIAATFEYMNIGVFEGLIIVLSFAIMLMLDRVLSRTDDASLNEPSITDKGGFIYVIWVVLFAWIMLIAKDMISSFIYFQF